MWSTRWLTFTDESSCLVLHHTMMMSEHFHQLWNASMSFFLTRLNAFEIQDSDDDGVGVIFTFILSVAVLISLTFLLGWHMYLVLTAQVCNRDCFSLINRAISINLYLASIARVLSSFMSFLSISIYVHRLWADNYRFLWESAAAAGGTCQWRGTTTCNVLSLLTS